MILCVRWCFDAFSFSHQIINGLVCICDICMYVCDRKRLSYKLCNLYLCTQAGTYTHMLTLHILSLRETVLNG